MAATRADYQNALNPQSPTEVTTPTEYDIIDPAEEVFPPTPSISDNESFSHPETKSSWNIGIIVGCVLLICVVLTVVLLGVYFVKRDD